AELKAQRRQIIDGVRSAFDRLLQNIPRLQPVADLNFPRTPVNTMSLPLALTATNETTESIQIARVDVAQPFAVQLPGPLPITVDAGAALSLPVTFTPTVAGVSAGTVRLLAAPAPSSSPNNVETVWVD